MGFGLNVCGDDKTTNQVWCTKVMGGDLSKKVTTTKKKSSVADFTTVSFSCLWRYTLSTNRPDLMWLKV